MTFSDSIPEHIVFCFKSFSNFDPKFLDSLKMFKQKVIWKYEDETLAEKVPPNVMIRKWLPQADILAHKNVRLFISHGGMFGNFEVIYLFFEYFIAISILFIFIPGNRPWCSNFDDSVLWRSTSECNSCCTRRLCKNAGF